jgi:hypothetical protein
MANYVLIRHSVEDFPKWKAAYDEHKPERIKAGVTENKLFQDADDPNMVTILFDAEDVQQAKEFTHSDEVREIMQKAGVVSQPDIHFLED